MAVIEEILIKLQAGSIDLAEAFALAAADNANAEMPVLQEGSDLTVARLDRNRETRCGFPEFIYGAGNSKTHRFFRPAPPAGSAVYHGLFGYLLRDICREPPPPD